MQSDFDTLVPRAFYITRMGGFKIRCQCCLSVALPSVVGDGCDWLMPGFGWQSSSLLCSEHCYVRVTIVAKDEPLVDSGIEEEEAHIV
jgi:hypothetical protein